jgi:hypothetical protein
MAMLWLWIKRKVFVRMIQVGFIDDIYDEVAVMETMLEVVFKLMCKGQRVVMGTALEKTVRIS